MRKVKQKRVTVLACSICGGPLYMGDAHWKGGNNAEPVNDGRCCDRCVYETVLPARVKQLKKVQS